MQFLKSFYYHARGLLNANAFKIIAFRLLFRLLAMIALYSLDY